MKFPRFPLINMAAITWFFIGTTLWSLLIWSKLFLGKPVTAGDVGWLVFDVAALVWVVMDFERYTFKREHLMAERKLTREYRALHACAVVIHDRFERGLPVRGTPLHQVALERQRRARDALNVAMWFRERRQA